MGRDGQIADAYGTEKIYDEQIGVAISSGVKQPAGSSDTTDSGY